MKSMRIFFILSGIITTLTIGIVAYLMFFGPDRLETAGKSLSEMKDNGALLAMIVIPLMLIISGVVVLPLFRILAPVQIKNGVTAQARVLKIWDTGVTVNDDPQVGLLLEVMPSMSNPFQIEAKTLVPRLQVALVKEGITAEVVYDPQNLKRVQIVKLNTQQGSAARLEELDALYEKRLITEDEYRKKREEILQSL